MSQLSAPGPNWRGRVGSQVRRNEVADIVCLTAVLLHRLRTTCPRTAGMSRRVRGPIPYTPTRRLRRAGRGSVRCLVSRRLPRARVLLRRRSALLPVEVALRSPDIATTILALVDHGLGDRVALAGQSDDHVYHIGVLLIDAGKKVHMLRGASNVDMAVARARVAGGT